VAIEEQERRKGLILRGGGDVLPDGEMDQERIHLGLAYRGRMAHVVEEDVTSELAWRAQAPGWKKRHPYFGSPM